MKKQAECSRSAGWWGTNAQNLVLVCYMTVQIVCYTQLNARLNDSLSRLDGLEILLSQVLSARPTDDIRPRNAETSHHRAAVKHAAVRSEPYTYHKVRRIDVEAKLNELQQRIGKLQERVDLVPPCNGSRASSTEPQVVSPGRSAPHTTNGRDGATGPQGDKEHLAPSQDQGSEPEGASVEEHDSAESSRKKRATPAGASPAGRQTVYIRWGQRQCRRGISSTLIYEGRMAGPSGGGGSNYLCVPLDPEFNEFTSGARHFTRLYGIEFGRVGDLFLTPGLRRSAVPCAVCRAPRAALLVVPAWNYCPSSHWTREYHGFLMAQAARASHSRTEYVCVDAYANGVSASNTTRPRGRVSLTPVLAECSTLPCPPYKRDRELTCAVCTS